MLQPSMATRIVHGLIVASVVVALSPVQAVHAQLTEAITRARKAAEQADQRNQATNAEAQKAMQEGTKAPAKAPPQGVVPTAKPAPAPPVPRRQAGAIKASGTAPSATLTGAAGGPGTHTVEKGETLWGIAQRYLSDPYLWPEIYRINTDVVEDPRWIYPGENLKLPGASAPATVGPVQVATPSVMAPPVAQPVVQQVEQEPEPPEGSTVFSNFRRASGTSRKQALLVRPSPIVRSGEFNSAPIVTVANGPAWSGRVLEALTGNSIGADRRDRAIQLAELVSINPPSGTPPQVGTRYLVIRQGPTVVGLGAIAIPTGVVEVEQVERGKAPVARVTNIYDALKSGQGLIPFERARLDSAARPTPVANGPTTTVSWVLADPVLATLQAFIVLNPKGVGAVRPGDVFAIIRPSAPTIGGPTVPEETIATAQVVRVTPQGITAVITGQKTGAIREGSPARLAARMPGS